jgi:sugar transferase (PEP-CTERM/EpsH1 system associated)
VNLLFLTHRLPYAPNRGDRIRAYHLLREFSTFADVSLFSLVHDEDEASHAGQVPFARAVATARVHSLRNRVLGAARLATRRPLTHSLLDAADARAAIDRLTADVPPDVVVAYCSGMARFAMEPPLAGVPFVLDMVDVDSEKWRSLAARTSPPISWIYRREAYTLAAFERDASRRAGAVMVVTEQERATLHAVAPAARIRVVPNGVDVDRFARPDDGLPREPTVVFCGMMNYTPNVQAVSWFAERVWPLVLANRPDARFVIVGANPSPAVQALPNRHQSIVVTGPVEDVRPHLWRATVAVAPLHIARGLQNKVLEALAAGLPVVITSAVAAGLPGGCRAACAIADEAGAVARAVIDALARAQPAPILTESHLAELRWETRLQGVRDLVDAVASSRRQEPGPTRMRIRGAELH